jgi:hypothetical protein
MSKHTPGPWLKNGYQIYVVEGDEKRQIALVERAEDIGVVLAAPDMLQCLLDSLALMPGGTVARNEWMQRVLAVIEKAEGRL